MPEKPRYPLIPRTESGTYRIPIDSTGKVPSLPPAGEEDTRAIAMRAQDMAQAAMQGLVSLRGEFEGRETHVQQLSKTLKEDLGGQDVEIARLNNNVSELLKLTKAQRAKEQREHLDSLHGMSEEVKLSAAEQKVFSGKGREVRLWLKALGVILLVIASLGSAAGISRCQNPHGTKIEAPE